MIRTIDQLRTFAEKWVADYERAKAEFISRLDFDPVHAMTWCDGMFIASVRYKEGAHLLESIDGNAASADPVSDEQGLKTVRDHALQRLLHSTTGHGGSETVSLAKRAETTMWSELYLALTDGTS